MKPKTRKRIACFGEILWDFLPRGLFPGGAPFNVAYHLHCHAAAVRVVSAVGRAILGDELMRRLGALRVFDVNLRAPFDDLTLVRRLVRQTDLLKLNNEEAAQLAGQPARSGNEETCARRLADELGCRQIVITAAERGAGFLQDG